MPYPGHSLGGVLPLCREAVGVFYSPSRLGKRLVFGSYSKIHVTSQVMPLWSKSDSVWKRSMMSWHTSMRGFFKSSFSSFGTIFAQTFHMPQSSVIIFQTLSFFISSWLAIIQTINRRSLHTTCFTSLTLNSFLLVESLCSWSHPSLSLEPLVPLKNICAWHGAISIQLLKCFKCL